MGYTINITEHEESLFIFPINATLDRIMGNIY